MCANLLPAGSLGTQSLQTNVGDFGDSKLLRVTATDHFTTSSVSQIFGAPCRIKNKLFFALSTTVTNIVSEMISTEPDPRFEVALKLFQHISGKLPFLLTNNWVILSGVISFAVNSLVLLLILSDKDSRNKHYRKYLGCFQVIFHCTFKLLCRYTYF